MSCCAMQGFQMFATAWFGAGHRVFEVMGESWSWVGSVDVTAVSRTEGSQSRGPRKTHREVLIPQLGSSAIRLWLCDICGSGIKLLNTVYNQVYNCRTATGFLYPTRYTDRSRPLTTTNTECGRL